MIFHNLFSTILSSHTPEAISMLTVNVTCIALFVRYTDSELAMGLFSHSPWVIVASHSTSIPFLVTWNGLCGQCPAEHYITSSSFLWIIFVQCTFIFTTSSRVIPNLISKLHFVTTRFTTAYTLIQLLPTV